VSAPRRVRRIPRPLSRRTPPAKTCKLRPSPLVAGPGTSFRCRALGCLGTRRPRRGAGSVVRSTACCVLKARRCQRVGVPSG
jgi:hypothetical protein